MFFRNKWTPLFLSNFLGIFNDNLLKYCIVFIAVGWSKPTWLSQSQLISLVSAALIVPYLFLSPLAGKLAVIYPKKTVFRICKLLEIPVLIAACVAFYFHWVLLVVLTVLLMGILSCLYSPSTYSLIRDIGGEEGVSFGSGVFEMMAFLGILVGTICASIIADYTSRWIMVGLLIGLGILGYIVTTRIKALELPENKENPGTINPFRFLVDSYRFARSHTHVNSAVFGASVFWLMGGMLQMNIVIHVKHVYHATNSTTGMVMAFAAIGIAFGTWAAGKISGKKVKKELILIGIAGMTVLFFILTLLHMNLELFIILIFSVAFLGGIFQIPCLAILQHANLGRKLGDMIAYLNLVTFIFVLLGTLIFSITAHFTSENSYAVFALMLTISLLTGIYFFIQYPEYYKHTKKIKP